MPDEINERWKCEEELYLSVEAAIPPRAFHAVKRNVFKRAALIPGVPSEC